MTYWLQNMLRCAWSPDGSKVAAGSSDRFVYVWDTTSRRILYKLPGHNGSVNDLDFHPKEPISMLYFLSCPHNPINLFFSVLSASSDKTIYLGEID